MKECKSIFKHGNSAEQKLRKSGEFMKASGRKRREIYPPDPFSERKEKSISSSNTRILFERDIWDLDSEVFPNFETPEFGKNPGCKNNFSMKGMP